MIPQNLLFNLVQCGSDRIDLGQYVHAVSIVLYHSEKTTDLAFDPLKAERDSLSCDLIHGLILYL